MKLEDHMYDNLIVSTIETVPGAEIARTICIVRGSSVRSKNIGFDIIAGLRNIVGGEIREYSDLMSAAREQAQERMLSHARQVGADAIVGVRIQTSMIAPQAAEVIYYGTAVALEPRG